MTSEEIFAAFKSNSGFEPNPPATEDDITDCILELKKIDVSTPPKEYLSFLMVCDGVLFNSIHLYGTRSYPHQWSLVKGNWVYGDKAKFGGHLVLGKLDEEFLLYDDKKKVYYLVDRMDGLIYEESDSFFDLIDFLVI